MTHKKHIQGPRKRGMLALKWKDISTVEGGIKVFVAISKTDKDKKGVWVHMASCSDELCPKKAILNLVLQTPKELLHRDQFVFAATSKDSSSNTALKHSTFSACIKKWIEFLELDPVDYSGHSLCRGGATVGG